MRRKAERAFESPRVALIRASSPSVPHPSSPEEEAIIFSAPKARYVSMRISLTDLMPIPRPDLPLSRIEDYDPKQRASSQRRLNGDLVSRKSRRAEKSRPILPSSSSSSFPSRFHSRHVCSEKNCASLSLSLSLFSKGNPALVSSWSLDKSRLTNERSFRAWRGGGYFAWKSVTNSSVALAPFFSLSPAGLRVTSRILVIRLWTRSFVTRQRFDSFSFSIAATRLEKLGRIHDDAVRQPHRRSLVFSSSLN